MIPWTGLGAGAVEAQILVFSTSIVLQISPMFMLRLSLNPAASCLNLLDQQPNRLALHRLSGRGGRAGAGKPGNPAYDDLQNKTPEEDLRGAS